MLVSRGLVFRLDPTPAQAQTLSRWTGACRAVYNAALIQRRDFSRAYRRSEGRSISYASQCRDLTALRAAFDWIRECPITPQQQALRDLDRAFGNFFARRARYPTPRRHGRDEAIRFQFRELAVETLNAHNARVRIPKLGWIRFRLSRPIEGDVVNATLSHDALGWRVAFSTTVEKAIIPAPDVAVGIDRGVANSLALSTGELLPFPRRHPRCRGPQAGAPADGRPSQTRLEPPA